MNIHFYKYQGTGNDFVLADNRQNEYNTLTESQIKNICDRRFGIGGDGFMLLQNHPDYDFEMVYYNADGRIGTMCGNGGRCIARFANDLGILKNEYSFLATDGPHLAYIEQGGRIALKMKDVDTIEKHNRHFVLNTGSPHYVQLEDNIDELDVFKEGHKIRYSPDFANEGINVNFVEVVENDRIKVRTYERGVENETYSCGTGVTAAALVFYHNENGFNEVEVEVLGGSLTVTYERDINGIYTDIWLKGPAEKVFEGTFEI